MQLRFAVPFAWIVFACTAVPQQAVPPPPRPADSGPSLEVTLRFLVSEIENRGLMRYKTQMRNSEDGSVKETSVEVEDRPVSANAADCTLAWHIKQTTDSRVFERDLTLRLKDILKIVAIDDYSGWVNQNRADHGITGSVYATVPPLYGVQLQLKPEPGKAPTSTLFLFLDKDEPPRVAKAFVHAVELCGGGYDAPF